MEEALALFAGGVAVVLAVVAGGGGGGNAAVRRPRLVLLLLVVPLVVVEVVVASLLVLQLTPIHRGGSRAVPVTTDKVFKVHPVQKERKNYIITHHIFFSILSSIPFLAAAS